MSVPASQFTAIRPLTLLGRKFNRGDAIPQDVLDKVPDLRKLVSTRFLKAAASVDVDALPVRAPAQARELLPLDTAAERQTARAELARMESSLEDAEAVGEKLDPAVVNAVAAYKSMLADHARTMRNPDTGEVGVSVELLAAMDATSTGEADVGEELPEGTIPTVEDGNDEGGSASAVIDPPKGSPVAQDASSSPAPGNPAPATPSASSGKGGRRK